jgi:hypothetical protein
VKLPAPKKGRTSAATRAQAKRDLKAARNPKHAISKRRSKATKKALKRSAASHKALSTHARSVARQRGPIHRHKSAMKAVHTKGPQLLREEARKAAETRAQKAG